MTFEEWWMDNATTINHRDVFGVAEKAWQAATKHQETQKAEPIVFVDAGHLREVSNGNEMLIWASPRQGAFNLLVPLYLTPPAVEAAYVKAAEVCEKYALGHDREWDYAIDEIRALSGTDALREFGLKVATVSATYGERRGRRHDAINKNVLNAIVDRTIKGE